MFHSAAGFSRCHSRLRAAACIWLAVSQSTSLVVEFHLSDKLLHTAAQPGVVLAVGLGGAHAAPCLARAVLAKHVASLCKADPAMHGSLQTLAAMSEHEHACLE